MRLSEYVESSDRIMCWKPTYDFLDKYACKPSCHELVFSVEAGMSGRLLCSQLYNGCLMASYNLNGSTLSVVHFLNEDVEVLSKYDLIKFSDRFLRGDRISVLVDGKYDYGLLKSVGFECVEY